MAQKQKNPVFSLRLDPTLKPELEREAVAQGRTVTNLINYILKMFLETKKEK